MKQVTMSDGTFLKAVHFIHWNLGENGILNPDKFNICGMTTSRGFEHKAGGDCPCMPHFMAQPTRETGIPHWEHR